MIAELDHTTATGTGLEGSTVVVGLDLSGTMQGAGGVGGLLAVRHNGQSYAPLLDGNGNVMGLVGLGGAKEGQVVARYDYDPFGNRITNTAPEFGEDVNPFGFSTKFTGEELGLVYYGYRYYDPVTGRWPSRDPIGERGRVNLYVMVGNDAVNGVDVLGLSSPIPPPDKNGCLIFAFSVKGEGTPAGHVDYGLQTAPDNINMSSNSFFFSGRPMFDKGQPTEDMNKRLPHAEKSGAIRVWQRCCIEDKDIDELRRRWKELQDHEKQMQKERNDALSSGNQNYEDRPFGNSATGPYADGCGYKANYFGFGASCGIPNWDKAKNGLNEPDLDPRNF